MPGERSDRDNAELSLSSALKVDLACFDDAIADLDRLAQADEELHSGAAGLPPLESPAVGARFDMLTLEAWRSALQRVVVVRLLPPDQPSNPEDVLAAVQDFLAAHRKSYDLADSRYCNLIERVLVWRSWLMNTAAELAAQYGQDPLPFLSFGDKPSPESCRLAEGARLRLAKEAADDGYRPANWFPKGMAPLLRKAAAPGRQTKRVRSKEIDGVVCYHSGDARRWWPSKMRPQA